MPERVQPNPACALENGRLCRHPLTNEVENQRLLTHEQTIKARFAHVVSMAKQA